ncbi:MAG: molybdenum cofactor biosynthesis protein MoaE [Flavobacteriia bacterium]|nr:molybdenum cofactor biosynthesis protein MoaE [Flavobacteriia bacterium]
MEAKKINNCFKDGAISAAFIGDSIAKHQAKTTIGAHQIFLGQVRKDMINQQEVQAIEYSAHVEMANIVCNEIRENAFKEFDLVCMHIYHSLGIVKAGEICLFVFVSSKHRKMAQKAIEFIVEEIKAKVPVFGKEILEDESHVWKVNQ